MSAHFIWPIREPFEKQVAGGLSRTGWRYGFGEIYLVTRATALLEPRWRRLSRVLPGHCR